MEEIGVPFLAEDKRKILIYCKLGSAAADRRGKELARWLSSERYEPVDVTHGEGPLPSSELEQVRLGVVIGGDGTLLTLARRLERKDRFPLVGINLGSLGFLTEFEAEETVSAVQYALEGKYAEHRRGLLQVEICQGDVCRMSGMVLNDAVITKDARTPMLKFDVDLDAEHLGYFRADGYIVATPTGSTAYGLSVGGPLLHPDVRATVLVPICSHSLSARPVVVPEGSAIYIRPRKFAGKVYLVLDGQINHELTDQDSVRVCASDAAVRLVRSPRHTWSDTLRRKLEMR